MKKGKVLFLVIVLGILGLAVVSLSQTGDRPEGEPSVAGPAPGTLSQTESPSQAGSENAGPAPSDLSQTGVRSEAEPGTTGPAAEPLPQAEYRDWTEREAAYGPRSDMPLVKVYGPEPLTRLAALAIHEKRPDVDIEQFDQPLQDKVWIEGTAASDYMSLSPKRVNHLEAARDKGQSVYSALCRQQKSVIRQTMGLKPPTRHVERKVYRSRYYARAVCPPPVVCAPRMYVGFGVAAYRPVYGYGGWYGWRGGTYGWRGGHYGFYRGGGGHGYTRHGHGGGFVGHGGAYRGHYASAAVNRHHR